MTMQDSSEVSNEVLKVIHDLLYDIFPASPWRSEEGRLAEIKAKYTPEMIKRGIIYLTPEIRSGSYLLIRRDSR